LIDYSLGGQIKISFLLDFDSHLGCLLSDLILLELFWGSYCWIFQKVFFLALCKCSLFLLCPFSLFVFSAVVCVCYYVVMQALEVGWLPVYCSDLVPRRFIFADDYTSVSFLYGRTSVCHIWSETLNSIMVRSPSLFPAFLLSVDQVAYKQIFNYTFCPLTSTSNLMTSYLKINVYS